MDWLTPIPSVEVEDARPQPVGADIWTIGAAGRLNVGAASFPGSGHGGRAAIRWRQSPLIDECSGVKVEIEGATGVESASSVIPARPFRVLVPDLRPGPAYIPRWPADSPRNASRSRRYARRPGKLTPVQESAIRALAHTKSLRSLAGDFGVSHETIRSVLKR